MTFQINHFVKRIPNHGFTNKNLLYQRIYCPYIEYKNKRKLEYLYLFFYKQNLNFFL